MKTKSPSLEYEAYLKRMQKIGNTKVCNIIVDSKKYAEYVKRMELNQALLEDIQKQHKQTIILRKQIVGHNKKKSPKWLRIMMVEDDQ